MIMCEGTTCVYGHCCVECDAQQSQGCTCGCTLEEEFEHDKNIIMEHCQNAEWRE